MTQGMVSMHQRGPGACLQRPFTSKRKKIGDWPGDVPIITALLGQEDHAFEASLGYTGRLSKTNNNKTLISLEGVWFHGFTDDGISASYQEK